MVSFNSFIEFADTAFAIKNIVKQFKNKKNPKEFEVVNTSSWESLWESEGIQCEVSKRESEGLFDQDEQCRYGVRFFLK